MAAPARSPAALADGDHAVLQHVVQDLRGVFGTRLRTVAAYGLAARGDGGPLRILVLVTHVTVEDLHACAPLAEGWRRAGVEPPLLLEEGEFQRTLDVFPVEYGDILAQHVTLHGESLAHIRIDPADLRRALELQAKSLVIHLREGYLESGGQAANVNALIAASAAALEALLRGLARLCGDPGDDLARFAEREVQVPADTVTAVLAAGRRPPGRVEDLTPLMGPYLQAAARIWQYVDAWRSPA